MKEAGLSTFKTKDGSLRTKKINAYTAIRIFCTQCMGYKDHPKTCDKTTCPLYLWRGKSFDALNVTKVNGFDIMDQSGS